MLNFIYYPVSAIMWFWHEVFGFLFQNPASGAAWTLSVVFLVFTLRALLIKPFISQVRSMRKMQEFQPQIKKLQEKYKGDRQKLAEEMQKLQKEHGVNPLGGCLPLLVQLPVFIGLFHVLRGFQPTYPYNYVFDRADIESFLNADLFGVRLSQGIAGGTQSLGQFSFNFGDFNPSVLPVALPLMIAAAVATHFTARVSAAHQSPAAAANPQAAIMQKLTMWLFPLGLLVFGAFFPVAILIYFLSQNTWTLSQQYLIYRKIDREESAMREQAREQRDMLAPKPGQKPQRPGRTATALGTVDAPGDTVAQPADALGNGSSPTTTGGSAKGRRHPGKVATGAAADRPAGSGQHGSGGTVSGGNVSGGNASGATGSSAGGAPRDDGPGARATNGRRAPGKVNGGTKSGGAKSGGAKSGGAKSGATTGGARTGGGSGKGSPGTAPAASRPGKKSKKRR